MLAARRAVELVPREPSPERATVLAALAQLKMLDGIFSEAQRLARDAIKVARACDPVARAQEVHATTTLAVALAWGKDPTASIELLREAETAARELDDPDALFRIRANLTTVLDLVSRRTEAVDVAYEGIEDARRAGLEAVYGNFLAGNVADTLFLLGRWPEARAVSERAMSWLPVGVVYLACVLQLAIVEIEMDAGENASRLLGQTILEFDAVREPQLAGPYYIATASFALWRGDVADASRSVDRGWAAVRATEEWLLVARMASMVAQVDAATAVEARQNRQLPPLAAARQRTNQVVEEASAAGPGRGRPDDGRFAPASPRRRSPPPVPIQRRLEGEDSGAVWRHVAQGWAALDAPYDVALARWRQAEATLAAAIGRSGRAQAQAPLLEAVELGLRLGAKPLLRELRELAGRARIALPPEVDVALDAGRVGVDGRDRTARRWADDDGGRQLGRSAQRPVRPRPCDRRRSTEPGQAPGHVRAQRARARGPRPGRPGTDQPRDRGAAVHQPEDGRRPRREHPGEARGLRSGRGRRGRDQAGPDRARADRAIPMPGTPRDPEGGLRVSIGIADHLAGWAPAGWRRVWVSSAPLQAGSQGQRDRSQGADGEGDAPRTAREILDHGQDSG